MTVNILLTPNLAYKFSSVLCVFKTIRIGFPTAEIRVYVNGELPETLDDEIQSIFPEIMFVEQFTDGLCHDEWMQSVFYNSTAPTVFCDPDIIFYENVEEKLKDLDSYLICGAYCPDYWNNVVEANEVKRLHTSLLYFPNPKELRKRIATITQAPNFPFNPFRPSIKYLAGKKFFYDTCANLFHFLYHDGAYKFNESILNAYTHLVSGSMLDLVADKIEGGQRLKYLHKLAEINPEAVKYLWKEQQQFYRESPVRL